jgi:hypothetical protein
MTDRLHRLAVAICGAGHSGSTLLGLALGSHSQCFYAGEAKKSTFFGDASVPLRKRACKLCGERCPVWSRVAIPPEPDLYEALARITERPVIVDSTKDVAWIRERAAELDRAGVAQKRIVLTRDGRAVVNSRLRKYADEDPARVIDAWIEQVERTEALAAERPSDVIRVRYEVLATEPEATLRRIAASLGLAFEPAMLRYEQAEHHPLGGNTGTQSVVARAGNAAGELVKVPERGRSFYAPLEHGFHLDLRWREELPESVQRLFDERAGKVNEPFRWEKHGAS